MSYTEIVGFDKEGEAYIVAAISNSWRGASAIWSILEEKYLPPYRPDYVPKEIPDEKVEEWCRYKPSRNCCMKIEPMHEIWDLVDSKDVLESERIVLFTTFDKCLVKKENLEKTIRAFRDFDGETSLTEQADVLEKMLNDENCIAVGWNQTSVSTNQWTNHSYDEESGDSIPYNCLTGKVHYWLFDEFKL